MNDISYLPIYEIQRCFIRR